MPATIGRYRVDGRLGKDATGIVYSAHDEVVDRRIGIKVIPADMISSLAMAVRPP